MASHDDATYHPRSGSLPSQGEVTHPSKEYKLVPRGSSRANKWWDAMEHSGGSCSRVLGKSRMTEGTLQRLVDEGKIVNRDGARLPRRDETEPKPGAMEAIVFVAFFDAGLRMPSTLFVGEVLRAYKLELAQLTPHAILRLAVFTWAMRTEGWRPSASLFATLHDAHCQPRKVGGAVSNFGGVDFVLRASCATLFPVSASPGQWASGWTRWWFYYTVTDKSRMQCRGGPISFNSSPSLKAEIDDTRKLQSLVGVARRMSVRDLAEEFTMYGAAPLSSRGKYVGQNGPREDGFDPFVSRLLPPSAPCKSPSTL